MHCHKITLEINKLPPDEDYNSYNRKLGPFQSFFLMIYQHLQGSIEFSISLCPPIAPSIHVQFQFLHRFQIVYLECKPNNHDQI